MGSNRKVILYIAMSLDGYIAKSNDDIGFLSLVEKPGEDYGYFEFIKSVDTIIIGRKTYDHVVELGYEYPHDDEEVFIITRTERDSSALSNTRYFCGDLKELITDLKLKDGKNIYCDGGAEVVNHLLSEDLIDEFIISVIPILLGDGIPLFKSGRPESKLNLINAVHFPKGLVQLHYERDPISTDLN